MDNTGPIRTPKRGEQRPRQREPRPRAESGPVLRDPARKSDPVAIGNAMKALFESSNVSIQRSDETRVINRSLPPSEPPPPAAAPGSRPPPAPDSLAPSPRRDSLPPSPRLDVWLWAVMAIGLFAIAGLMIAFALR